MFRKQYHVIKFKKRNNKYDTYGSNSWITLSNLRTEKSLVEKAERRIQNYKHV